MNYLKISLFILLNILSFAIIADSNLESQKSLRDKIGQMLIIGFDGKTVNKESAIIQQIYANNIGGVILFDYNYQTKSYDKNIENPKQLKLLNESLQKFTKLANIEKNRPNLPLIISVDYEGGKVNRLKESYGFPKTLSANKISEQSLDAVKKNATVMAKALKQNGFNLDFAPVLDVNLNSENPVIAKIERSFSSDPHTVAKFASIYAEEFSKYNIQCAYKHFPGHGSSNEDSHRGFVDVTKTWQKKELIPYELLLNKKNSCNIVMSAHIINRNLDQSGLPATLSYKILTQLLRNKLQFNGVIVTDDMQMNAIYKNFTLEDAITKAINAGADMLIFGNQLQKNSITSETLIDIIEKQVKNNKISSKRIDDAYKRISQLKNKL